jgi:DNA-binding FrmR family transcriptional regulator
VSTVLRGEPKKRTTARLKRIEGQVGGILRMVEDDRYCVDVLLQIAAARAALDRVGKLVLENHIATCVSDAFESGKPAERRQKMDELMEVFARFGSVKAP